jgi:retinol dehydrogenase 12
MGCAPSLTPDGFEIQMATNHLGHAMLLKLPQPILAPDARIVSMSSSAWKHSPPGQKIDFDTLRTASNDVVPPVFRYVQSKIANLLYAQQYAKRSAADHHPGHIIVSINPGEVKTNLFTREPGDEHMKKLQTEVAPKIAGPIEDGVKNQLWAATTAAANLVNGAHYAPVGVEEKWGIADDEELAEQLWAWTEEALAGQV